MRKGGVEPPQGFPHRNLNGPSPPLNHEDFSEADGQKRPNAAKQGRHSRSGTSIESEMERALRQALSALRNRDDDGVVRAFVEVASRMTRGWPQ